MTFKLAETVVWFTRYKPMGVGVSWVMGFVYLGLVIPHSIAIKTAQIFVGNSDYGDITDITRYYGITLYIYIYMAGYPKPKLWCLFHPQKVRRQDLYDNLSVDWHPAKQQRYHAISMWTEGCFFLALTQSHGFFCWPKDFSTLFWQISPKSLRLKTGSTSNVAIS